ncbi:hypothetical protein C1645_748018 [Glomus cerebriforme]|uniref:Uncharacterized protein n=1 Tax=Glomus cerebriforme TaxID=658196 RepID=A0A397TW79_9GLOM|nr:hypothetical protein C1645_748018 [Glomus cerebriforme]
MAVVKYRPMMVLHQVSKSKSKLFFFVDVYLPFIFLSNSLGNPSSDTNKPGTISNADQSSNNKNVSIAIGVSATLLSGIIAIILIIWYRRKRNKTQSGYLFDTITRNIGNAFGGNSTSSEEKRMSALKAGLVKGNNTNTNSSGNYSTGSSNLPTNFEHSNNEAIFDNKRTSNGIFITKTQSVSIQKDNDYFGTSSLSNISSANSFVSIDNTTKSANRSSFTSNTSNTKSISSVENLNINSTSNGNNKYSSSDSGYLANSSNMNTSSEDDNSRFALNVITF